MTVEALGAIAAGVFSGSLALLAFGGDSIIELASSVAVLDHLRTEGSGEGSDDKTERTERATLLLLFLLIPAIALGTTYAYFSGVEPEPSLLGILIAIGALVIMPVLWFEKRRIGKTANCFPIEVDATESATCFLMSAALLVGLITNFLWRLWWVDYLATVIILFFLAREGVESFHNFRTKGRKSIF
jgi:divalent metal cation (Fe/Co/Zn/Cd) transporter